ncbi:MAG: hypothetical protein DMF90_27925 [Acidobacteria bacterium]|nr:MAG: hypothetical protein DMF90_27925 [Acidobacteriota bacterium]
MPPTVAVAHGLYLWTLTLADGTTRTVSGSSADSVCSGVFPSPVVSAVRGAAFDGSAEASSPVLTSLNPTTSAIGGAAFTLQAIGTGFNPGAQILWDGTPKAVTTYVSATELTSIVNPALETVGTHQVKVRSLAGVESVATLPFTTTATE